MFIETIKKFFNGANMSDPKPAQPAATSANGIPDLGDALLSPGLLARKAEAKIPLPEPAPVIEEAIAQPTPAPEPALALISALDTDYDNVTLPPRSPEMIRRLIDAGETDDQRARRFHSDIARFRHHRGL